MTPLDILTQARALIVNPEHRCIESYAEDVAGIPIDPHDPRAVRFCALGACRRVTGVPWGKPSPDYALAEKLLETVALDQWGEELTEINDTHDHADVLAMFDFAIEGARKC